MTKELVTTHKYRKEVYMRELKIDPELRDLLPALTQEEYRGLEKSMVEKGFDKAFPIMEWKGYIADGHNRYEICKKHNIEPIIGTLAFETKDQVIEWMFDIQLNRRNLTPIQRIAIAERKRAYYEKKARENQSEAGGDKRSNMYKKSLSVNLPKAISQNDKIDVRAKLAETAGVSERTYSMGKKILDSDNEEVKQKVMSGEMSINAGYNKIKEEKEEYDNRKPTHKSILRKPSSTISDETKQICADLKTEKTKEYLESIWDYKIAIIDCMNADFEKYFDGFVSILNDMENRVTKKELNECIENAENIVEKMLSAIEDAKNIKTKMED